MKRLINVLILALAIVGVMNTDKFVKECKVGMNNMVVNTTNQVETGVKKRLYAIIPVEVTDMMQLYNINSLDDICKKLDDGKGVLVDNTQKSYDDLLGAMDKMLYDGVSTTEEIKNKFNNLIPLLSSSMGGAMIGNTLASAGDSLPALKDNILNNVVSQKPDTPINPDLGGGGTQVPDTPINPDLGGGGTQVPDTPINPDLGGGGTQVPVQPNLSGKEDILVTETESVFAPVTSAVSALGATGATMAYNGIVQPAVSTLNSLPPLPVIASLGNSTATSPIMTGMAALDDKDFLIDEEIANIKKLKDHFFNILSKKDKQSPIVLIYEVEEKGGNIPSYASKARTALSNVDEVFYDFGLMVSLCLFLTILYKACIKDKKEDDEEVSYPRNMDISYDV